MKKSYSSFALTFLGILSGVALVALLQKRASTPRLPDAAVWQAELEKEKSPVEAAMLLARVQKRYRELYANRPRFSHPALQRQHLEENILPGLALYQTLLEESADREAALEKAGRLLEADVRKISAPIRTATRLPFFFDFFRPVLRAMMLFSYPPQGWKTEWVIDTRDAIGFDLQSCFYVQVLNAYGAPELTPLYCHLDDVMMEYADRSIQWSRTTTLARGGPACDFRYYRIR